MSDIEYWIWKEHQEYIKLEMVTVNFPTQEHFEDALQHLNGYAIFIPHQPKGAHFCQQVTYNALKELILNQEKVVVVKCQQ